MKKVCLILALGFLLLPIAARAWWLPDDAVFGTREELPAGAQALLPEAFTLKYAYEIGDYLYVWTKDARGNGVVFAFIQADDGYSLLVQSAPLGVWNGLEPSLGYSGSGFFSIDYSESFSFMFKPRRDGRWALQTAFLYGQTDCFISFYPHAAAEFLSTRYGYRMVYGTWTRPLCMDALEVSVLPRTFEDALSMLDTRGWAMVLCSDSESPAPLRAAPDAEGEILGSYYTGAPAEILEEAGMWRRVSIAGAEGWLPAEALVFGEGMREVPAGFPALVLTQEAYTAKHILYASPSADGAPIGLVDFYSSQNPDAVEDLFIVGIVNGAWYHVMNWRGDQGYIECKWFYEGNG